MEMSAFTQTESNAVHNSSNGSLNLLDVLQNQQKTIMSGLSRSMIKDDVWYLLAMPWFEQWKKYVGQTRGTKAGEASHHPGKIDNSPLLDPETGNLRRNLIDLDDYSAVPEDCWKILEKYYGVMDNNTSIRRIVIITGTYAQHPLIEIYPLNISVCHHENIDQMQSIQVSRVTKVDELKTILKQKFSVPQDHDAQLWMKLKSLQVVDLLTDKGSSTLEQLNVTDDSLFILETKHPNDKWKSSNPDFVKKAATALGAEIKTPEPTSASGEQRFGTVSSTSQAPAYHTRSWIGSLWSTSKDEVEGTTGRNGAQRGLCGLQNLGNTCFMNSALQCLSNVPDLTKFFLSDEYKSQINYENKLGMKGKLAERYAALIKAIWSGKYNSVAPRDFKSTVGDYAPRFHGYAQQDSSELLSFLLDGLHEDLNRIIKKPYREIEDADSWTDEKRANEYWQYYRERNDSKIVDLFHGQLKSTLRCNECGKIAPIFDPFCYLSLPIPRRDSRPVNVLFRYSDPSRKMTKVPVIVNRSYSTEDIRNALAKNTNVSVDKICLGGLTISKRVHFYKTSSSMDDREEIIAFEVPSAVNADANSEDVVPVAVYLQSEGKMRSYPYLIIVSKNATTVSSLVDALMQFLQPFAKTVEGKIEKSDQPEFKLKLMNYMLTNVIKEFDVNVDADQTISEFNDGSIHYLIMDWNDDALENRFDVEKLECIDTHPAQGLAANSLLGSRNQNGLQLEECLFSFLQEEQLSEQDAWYCPNCKKHQEAYKKFDLWRLPPYLIIHLKRFQQQRWRVEKMDTFVNYPSELDISKFVLNDKEKSEAEYELIGVSNHYGGLGGGHYTAYCYNANAGRWFTYDDSSVSPMSPEQVVSKAGYLLFYKRKSHVIPGVVTQQPAGSNDNDDKMDTSS